MRTPIRLRLFLTFLLILLLGMGIAAGLAWLSVEQLFLDTLRDNLLAQAKLTALALQDSTLPQISTEVYSQTSNVQPGIHTRLLDEQGGVVVGLPITPDTMPVQVPLAENIGSVSPDALLQRVEIQSALQGIPAAVVRRVASAENRRVLYAAAPVLNDLGDITNIVYLATPLPAARLPENIILQLVGAVVAAVLLAGIVGIVLSRRIARPLEDLVHAAGAVSRGDLHQHVPLDEDILELHSLGQAFNTMTTSLRRTDQVKNAFIADVTHELRNPLTVIKGTIETLEDGALDDLEGRGPLLASMSRETDRLIRMVNDLLVLIRADAGVLNLQVKPINLAELAQARCSSLSMLAAPRGLQMSVQAQGVVNVLADPDRLSQVFDNLLDNAIRYAPKGSTITLDIQRTGDEIQCAVIDQGPGIPEKNLPFIFERFYRADTSRTRNTGGSGLGLAIVQSLVEAHSGRIAANSVLGKGTAITFWLPANTDI